MKKATKRSPEEATKKVAKAGSQERRQRGDLAVVLPKKVARNGPSPRKDHAPALVIDAQQTSLRLGGGVWGSSPTFRPSTLLSEARCLTRGYLLTPAGSAGVILFFVSVSGSELGPGFFTGQ